MRLVDDLREASRISRGLSACCVRTGRWLAPPSAAKVRRIARLAEQGAARNTHCGRGKKREERGRIDPVIQGGACPEIENRLARRAPVAGARHGPARCCRSAAPRVAESAKAGECRQPGHDNSDRPIPTPQHLLLDQGSPGVTGERYHRRRFTGGSSKCLPGALIRTRS